MEQIPKIHAPGLATGPVASPQVFFEAVFIVGFVMFVLLLFYLFLV